MAAVANARSNIGAAVGSTGSTSCRGACFKGMHIQKRCTMRRSTIGMMVYLPLVFVLLCHYTLTFVQAVDLCVVLSPLETPYLIGAVDDPTPCHGCTFAPPTAPSGNIEQVHVVHVTAPQSGRVLVILQGAPQPPPKVALLLHSSMAEGAVFAITAPEYTALQPPKVIISGHDRLEDTNLSVEHHPQSFQQRSLVEAAYTQLGFITSYTSSDDATRIVIHLDRSASHNGSKGCDTSVQTSSPVAQCYITRPVPLDGCYHQSMLQQSGIHIISVDDSHDEVTIEVVGSENWHPVPRNQNLTLVLTSPKDNIVWNLETARLSGRISVVLGKTAARLKHRSSNDVTVLVQRRELPVYFDQLMMLVLNSIGSFNSYTNSGASRIRLTISPLPELRDILSLWLIVECSAHELHASLPRWVADKISDVTGSRLTMEMVDHPFCRSTSNGTHLSLVARLDGCGFWKEMHRQKAFFINEVSVTVGAPLYSDDEDFAGSGSGLDDDDFNKAGAMNSQQHIMRVQCPAVQPANTILPPILLGTTPKGAPSPTTPSASQVTTTTPGRPQESLQLDYMNYTLQVEVLPRKENEKDFRLKTTARLGSRSEPWVRLVIERCWVNEYLNPDKRKETLVRKSCAESSTTTIAPRTRDDVTGFTFVVTENLRKLPELFLHCELGICSNTRHKKKIIEQCIEPSLYCSKMDVRNIFFGTPPASHVRLLTSGPLPTWPPGEGGFSDEQSASSVVRSAASPSTDHQQRVTVIQGLTPLIVIFISIASFLIGVCLTGTIWIIHLKTDPRRQQGPEPCIPRHSGYDLSGNSGSTTPSSQAPMTT